MEDFCQFRLFKNARPNLMIPPPYVRSSEGQNDYRKVPTVQLKSSDPAKLLLLLESLKHSPSTSLQLKINKYLLQELNCKAVFLMELDDSCNKAIINVISDVVMKIDIRMPKADYLINEICKNVNGLKFELNEMNVELLDVIQETVPDLKGDVYAFPLFLENVSAPLLIAFILNCEQKILFVHHLIQETFRFCLPLFCTMRSKEMCLVRGLETDAIIQCASEFFCLLDNLNDLILDIVIVCKTLINSEKGSLYLLDKMSGNLITRHFETETTQSPSILPNDKGILGQVIKTGDVVFINDAQNSSLHLKSDDCKYGFKTKNMLCFPLMFEESAIGAVLLSNKLLGDYNVNDQNVAITLSEICGASIRFALLFEEMENSITRFNISTKIMYSPEIKDVDVKHFMYAKAPKCEGFGAISFDARTIPNHRTTLFIGQMFEKLGFVKKFHIEKRVLAKFIISVYKAYENLPYHNWTHAFSTTHFLFSIIQSNELIKRKILSDIEALALIVSCLCHDINHTGSEIFCESLYTPCQNHKSNDCNMEKHHLAQTLNILNTEGCNILICLSLENYTKCLTLIKHNILSTNFSMHLKSMKKQEALLTKMFHPNNPEQKLLLCSLLMVCADIYDFTKEWKVARVVSGQLYEECLTYGDMSNQKTGNQIIDMNQLDITFLPDLQMDFLRDVALPAFTVLMKIFPSTQFCVQSILHNIRCWEVARQHFLYKDMLNMTVLEILNSSTLDFTDEDLYGVRQEDETSYSPSSYYE